MLDGVKVKPLVWSEPSQTANYPEWRTAGLLFKAVIDKSQPRMYGEFPLIINGIHTVEKFSTLKDAKAFAEAKYKADTLHTLGFYIST